jgi:DNA modification methylase
MKSELITGNCLDYLQNSLVPDFDLTFLDPPFNQGKKYVGHDDNMDPATYWQWITSLCAAIYNHTSPGGGIYFMHREKNAQQVLAALTATGWQFQNLIIWKKKATAIPQQHRYSLQHQIIVFATKGERPLVFNPLRIDIPLAAHEKTPRPRGILVTDVWDDIRELTSGYYAGAEPLRRADGTRLHNQQAPVHLLTRILLTSTQVGDVIFDPFAGTATSLIVAAQLSRIAVGVEMNPENVAAATKRLQESRTCDNILKYREYYRHTKNLEIIWPELNNGLRYFPVEIANKDFCHRQEVQYI